MSSINESATLESLVTSLNHGEPDQRLKARHAIVRLGSAATASLVTALGSPHNQVRWEAAKALTVIADPAAASALVQTLGDRDGDVRWVAGEALIALGRRALEPLLESLVVKDHPTLRYEGAHHVLKGLIEPTTVGTLSPVVAALEADHPEVSTPVAAETALSKLRGLIR